MLSFYLKLKTKLQNSYFLGASIYNDDNILALDFLKTTDTYDKIRYKLIFEITTEPDIHFEYPFECDQTGGIFKIPSTITKYAHVYRIALVIVENIEPTNEGNLPTHTEVFSSYAWEGAVKKSFFDLNAIKRALYLESDQLHRNRSGAEKGAQKNSPFSQVESF